MFPSGFSYRDYNWFWVPIVGPHVGAVIGAWIYLIFVGNHIRKEDQDDAESTIGIIDEKRLPPPDYDVNVTEGNGPGRYGYVLWV